MSIENMKDYYKAAEKNYEYAADCYKTGYDKTGASAQKEGDRYYAQAHEEAEKEKKDIRTEACKDASKYYDKSSEAYKKGDMKAAKEYQEKGDQVMSDAKKKEKEIDKEEQKAASEARSKMEGLKKTRY